MGTDHADTRRKDSTASLEALGGKVAFVQWQLVAVLGGVAILLIKAFF